MIHSVRREGKGCQVRGTPPNSKGDENLGVPYPVGCSCPHPAQKPHPPSFTITTAAPYPDIRLQHANAREFGLGRSSLLTPKDPSDWTQVDGEKHPSTISSLLCAHKLPSSLSATSLLPSLPHFCPEPQLKALIPSHPHPSSLTQTH